MITLSRCEEWLYYLAVRVAVSVEFEQQVHRVFSAHVKCDNRRHVTATSTSCSVSETHAKDNRAFGLGGSDQYLLLERLTAGRD